MSLLTELKAIIGRADAQLTEEDKALAERLMLRYSDLAIRKLNGDNVDDDIAVVMANLENIRAGVYGSLAAELRNVVFRYVSDFLNALVRA